MALEQSYPSSFYLQFSDNYGKPLANGTIKTFLASDHSYPVQTFTYPGSEVKNPTNIILDEAGRCTFALDNTLAYYIELYDSTGALVGTWDNVTAGGGGSGVMMLNIDNTLKGASTESNPLGVNVPAVINGLVRGAVGETENVNVRVKQYLSDGSVILGISVNAPEPYEGGYGINIDGNIISLDPDAGMDIDYWTGKGFSVASGSDLNTNALTVQYKGDRIYVNDNNQIMIKPGTYIVHAFVRIDNNANAIDANIYRFNITGVNSLGIPHKTIEFNNSYHHEEVYELAYLTVNSSEENEDTLLSLLTDANEVLPGCHVYLDYIQIYNLNKIIGSGIDVTSEDNSVTIHTSTVNGVKVFDLSVPEQTQADWDEMNSEDPAYIKNKPNLAPVATSGSYNSLTDKPTIPDPQVQSDYAQTDSSAVDYIKNKPVIRNVPEVESTDDEKVLTASYSGGEGSFSWEPAPISLPPSTSADEGKVLTVDSNGEAEWRTAHLEQEQADYAQTDSSAVDYIKNKPDLSVYATNTALQNGLATKQDTINDLSTIRSGAALGATAVQDPNYVHTDNNFTSTLKDKLDGIEAGAEVNVQADWNQSNSSADDYIKNKPGNATTSTAGLMSAADKTKLDGIQSGAEANVQSDWTQNDSSADDYIKNKPLTYGLVAGTGIDITVNENEEVVVGVNSSIPQVQSNWAETNVVAKSYIQNKPNLATVATTGNYNDLINKPNTNGVPDVTSSDNGKVLEATYEGGVGSYSWQVAPISLPSSTSADAGKTLVVNSSGRGAWAMVQSDWNQADNTSNEYIKNKPTNMPLKAGNRISFAYVDDQLEISAAAASQVQSDWDQSNSSAVDYIKNKPTIPAAQVNADWNSSSGVSEILNKPNLSTVATSGDYDDLTNKPTIPAAQVQSDYAQTDSTAVDYIKNKPTLFSGNYNDLTNKPDLSIYAESSNLASVATSGSYNDLSNKPTIPAAQVNADWNASSGVAEILNKPNLATVATTGSYNDLSNTPTIPDGVPTVTSSDNGKVLKATYSGGAGSYSWETESGGGGGGTQVQSNWMETDPTAVSYIQNKPNLATVATSGSYNDLSNTPTIPTVDQTYNASSTNAQSGVAVASAIIGKQDTISAGNMISISSNAVGVSTTAGITDIVKVQALPANPVATVLYLIEE